MPKRSVFGLDFRKRYEDLLPSSATPEQTTFHSNDSLEALYNENCSRPHTPTELSGPHSPSKQTTPPPCLRRHEKSSSSSSSPVASLASGTVKLKRTCFSAHNDVLLSTSSSDSGWWTKEELKVFKDRILTDSLLPANVSRSRTNSIDARYDYDTEKDGDTWGHEIWLDPRLLNRSGKEDSNPQQGTGKCRGRGIAAPGPPPVLMVTTEAEKSLCTLKISPPAPIHVTHVLIASKSPTIYTLITKHIMSLYSGIRRDNVIVISSLTQKLERDIPFDIVFVESSFENSHLIGSYYRHHHPTTLIIGLDRPPSASGLPQPKLPDKVCHMIWSLPPPKSDETLKARLDNAFGVVRREGGIDI